MKRSSSSNPHHKPFEEVKAAGNFTKKSSGPPHNQYPWNSGLSDNYNIRYKQLNFKQDDYRGDSSVTKPQQPQSSHCLYGANCYRRDPDHIRQYHQPSFQPNFQHNLTPAKEFGLKNLFYCFSHYGMDKEEQQYQKSQMFFIANKTHPLLETLNVIEKLANLKGSLLTDFIRDLPSDQRKLYQDRILPTIANFALQTPTLFPNADSLPLLSQGSNQAVQLTREQCACLVANMFLCTTINQHNSTLNRRFNFSDLFIKTGHSSVDKLKKQKIACILNYFKQIMKAPSLTERVTFKRLHLDDKYPGSLTDIEGWKNCRQILQNVQMDNIHKIEDAKDSVEVDFANKFLGGGVLGQGAVQEEIQFITRPEQLAGLLFCESMTDKEAILIQGAKMYSQYLGYSKSFTFKGSNALIEESKREVVAMDAIDFSTSHIPQFSEIAILRELNKAYIAFYGDNLRGKISSKKPVSTGNWGCGAFRGDLQLKFILQWIAASRAERKLIYHPLNEPKFCEDAKAILNIYKEKSVGTLVKDVLYCSQRIQKSQESQFFECLKKPKERTREVIGENVG